MCLFDCATRQKMVVHYVNNHGVSIDEQQLEFDDHAAFLVWKERIEQSEVCQFFSRTGPLDRRNVRIRYYRCFRDGHFLSKGKGLRQMKKKGSIKINSVCPAMMKTEEDKTTGAVRVTYIHTHVGHLQEFGHLNLLKSKRAEIAQNIPYGIILDKETNDVYDSCDVVFGSYDGVANEIVICELQGNSIEEIIVRDFSKNSSSLCNVELDEKKAQIRSRFESLMKKIQSDDHAEILWKALLSVEKTFEENPSLPITSGESSKKINANKNIFS
ncbi:ZnF_C2H2 [Nesidiocoris tenuis]|nr:ZnF_C2H2 [Nesidiocoris tenuis]